MNKAVLTTLATVVAGLLHATPLRAASENPGTVDFRFSSPEWQTAICLPDDPHKSLVDEPRSVEKAISYQ